MHASKDELPILVEAGPSSVRGADWSGMRVSLVSVPAGADFAPLLRGLPQDLCQGEHWGYVVRGRLRVTLADGTEEVLSAGDFYHLPAGHTGVAEEDTDFIEVGEPGPHQQFVDQAKKNIAAMSPA
ncbi:MAG: cupin domain-containing protein [Hyphomicrobiales bacterium]